MALQLLQDWGVRKEGGLYVDSSAALGIVGRRGCGRMRYVRAGNLWFQEKRESGELRFSKVKGTENLADLMTKYLARDRIENNISTIGQVHRSGQAETCLEMQKVGTA